MITNRHCCATDHIIRDPRTPEVLAWLDAMPLDDRFTVMQAMVFAFAILKNSREWNARLDVMRGDLALTDVEHENILITAATISERVKGTFLRGTIDNSGQ